MLNKIIALLRNKDKSINSDVSVHKISELAVEEIREARKLLIMYEQCKIKNSVKFPMWEKSLGLYEDEEGFIRCRGRLGKSEWDYATKFPILLNSESHFTSLFILLCHSNVKHMGLESTLNEFRCHFLLIRGLQTVKKVISRCVICKKCQAKTSLPPPSPDLPAFRVAADHCFQFTGTDFAGPIFVKDVFSNTSKNT